ncbi:hypothetical protein RhiirA4_419019 [Rhizophagus irregularis]|uniref:Uncharacterized protein n=1 Tax=Rhizophagus irregularis TaxID=588596 RepID=A0A2I1GCR2_9GLOM|nr:hypothetical protein RhiirA4_419019 [Rhizophagus irregularis]
MDFGLNNEKKNKRNHFLNIIFLGIFLVEIIIYIIGIVILPIRTDWLITFASVFFVSGIYTFFRKTLLYLLAFCVVNIIQSIILIDIVQSYSRYMYMSKLNDVNVFKLLIQLVTEVTKPDVVKKLSYGIDEKEYRTTLIIPNIIASGLIIFFVFLYIILIIMMWKNKYWNVISRTKILIPNDIMIKKSYITYKFYNFLLYIILYLIYVWTLIGIGDNLYGIVGIVIIFLSLFTLTLSLIIIKKELKCSVFLIYIALILQGFLSLICAAQFPITRNLGLTLLGLTFMNTILCHRNFGKNFIFYVESMKFNPNLDEEFEYSNDLDDDDDDDDKEEEEEEEKDEKIFEKLKRYWKFTKKTFYDVFIPLIEE